MVAIKSVASIQDDLDDLFGFTEKPLPSLIEQPPIKIVVNPVTCAMVNLNDTTPSGIDRMIEALQDIKEVKTHLDMTRRQIEHSLESLCDKASKSRTHHIIGSTLRLDVEYPSRDFNNSVLKGIWNEFSEKIERLILDDHDFEKSRDLAKLRQTFLRITEVSVNLKDFKLYEGDNTTAPPEYKELAEKIARCEERGGFPSFKLPERKEDHLGSDPLVVQRLNE